jgi:hypothetical protein
MPPPKKKTRGRRGPNWAVSLKKVLTEVSPPVLGFALPEPSLLCSYSSLNQKFCLKKTLLTNIVN